MKLFLSIFLALAVAVLCLPSQGLTFPIIYIANLDGPSEDPPVQSSGTGSAVVTFDDIANTLRVEVTFSGLTGNTTAAHIHAPTAQPFTGNIGVATQTPSFAGFPLGVTSGTFDNTFDLTLLSSFNIAFVNNFGGGTAAGAEAALAAALAEGRAYFNIHSTEFTGGEIRGFLVVPAPATMLLFSTGLAGLAVVRLRRKKQ